MTSSAAVAPNLRLRPLSAYLAAVLASWVFVPALAAEFPVKGNSGGFVDFATLALRRNPAMPTLAARHATKSALVKPRPANYVGVRSVVGDCGDGSAATTLRNLIAAANSGDTIDLSTSGCSTITLLSGAIAIPLDDLTIVGPAARTTIDANHVDRAFYHEGKGTLTLQNLAMINGSYVVTNDVAGGGCISSAGSVALSNDSISGCYLRAQYAIGGGVASESMTITASSITGNTVKGIYIYTPPAPPPGNVSKPAATAANSTAVALAGGAYAHYNATVLNSTISGNLATVDPRLGGGLYGAAIAAGGGLVFGKYSAGQQASLPTSTEAALSTITGSTIDTNRAATAAYGNGVPSFGVGGGFFTSYVVINNSTVSGNSADESGGVAAKYGLLANNTTISTNTATYIGGVLIAGTNANVALHSTIIAANTQTIPRFAADLSDGDATLSLEKYAVSRAPRSGAVSATTSAASPPDTFDISHSLITTHDFNIPLPPGTIRANPLLGALANNGGTTRTQALLSGSPAIDAGENPLGLPFDQRNTGFTRVAGAAPDIGAFESQVVLAPRTIPTASRPALALLGALLAWLGSRARTRRAPVRVRRR